MRDPPEWKRPRQSPDSWGVTTVEGSKGAVGFQSNQQLRRNQKPYSHTSVLLPMQAPLYLRVRKNKGWAITGDGFSRRHPFVSSPGWHPAMRACLWEATGLANARGNLKRGEKTDGGSHSRYFATSWWFFGGGNFSTRHKNLEGSLGQGAWWCGSWFRMYKLFWSPWTQELIYAYTKGAHVMESVILYPILVFEATPILLQQSAPRSFPGTLGRGNS